MEKQIIPTNLEVFQLLVLQLMEWKYYFMFWRISFILNIQQDVEIVINGGYPIEGKLDVEFDKMSSILHSRFERSYRIFTQFCIPVTHTNIQNEEYIL